MGKIEKLLVKIKALTGVLIVESGGRMVQRRGCISV